MSDAFTEGQLNRLTKQQLVHMVDSAGTTPSALRRNLDHQHSTGFGCPDCEAIAEAVFREDDPKEKAMEVYKERYDNDTIDLY